MSEILEYLIQLIESSELDNISDLNAIQKQIDRLSANNKTLLQSAICLEGRKIRLHKEMEARARAPKTRKAKDKPSPKTQTIGTKAQKINTKPGKGTKTPKVGKK
jgi:hypothetical protein